MTVTVRPLPTPYDPSDGRFTAATPSCCGCCCCCCCCLNALSASAGFTAGAALGAARAENRPAAGPTVLGALALPAFFLMGGLIWPVAARDVPYAALLAAALPTLAFVAVAAGALTLAGKPVMSAVPIAAAVALATFGAFVVELPLVLATGFLIELAAPLSLVGGFFLGRRMLGYDRDPPFRSTPIEPLWGTSTEPPGADVAPPEPEASPSEDLPPWPGLRLPDSRPPPPHRDPREPQDRHDPEGEG